MLNLRRRRAALNLRHALLSRAEASIADRRAKQCAHLRIHLVDIFLSGGHSPSMQQQRGATRKARSRREPRKRRPYRTALHRVLEEDLCTGRVMTRLCCVIINPIGAHWGTCAHWLEGFCALDLICMFELIHSWRHPFDNGVVLEAANMKDNDGSASARYLRARCAAVDAALDAGCGLDVFGDRTLKAFNKAYESDDSSVFALPAEQLHNELELGLEIGRSRNRQMLSSARRLEEASAAAYQMPATVPRPPIEPRSEIARLRRRLDTVATPEEDDRAIALVSARRHHTNASADSGVPCTQPPRLTPRPQGIGYGDMTPHVDTLSQSAPWPATVAIRDATSSTVSGKQPQPRQYQYEPPKYQPQSQPQPPTPYLPRAEVSPRSQPPPSPRQGAAPWGTATVSATVPPAQLPETASNADVEWKISDDMMQQPWGSILRTLQPSAMNSLSVPSKVTVATTAMTGSGTDRLLRAPAPGFREAMASPRVH